VACIIEDAADGNVATTDDARIALTAACATMVASVRTQAGSST